MFCMMEKNLAILTQKEELGIDISSLTGKKLISKKRKEQKDFYDVWIVYGEFGLHYLS